MNSPPRNWSVLILYHFTEEKSHHFRNQFSLILYILSDELWSHFRNQRALIVYFSLIKLSLSLETVCLNFVYVDYDVSSPSRIRFILILRFLTGKINPRSQKWSALILYLFTDEVSLKSRN